MLLEGNSVSSVVRLTDVHQKTILKLLVLAGEKCERIMAEKIRNVKVRDVELDEVWARRKSASVPRTIRIWATAMCSSESRGGRKTFRY
jgi:hypothetical protein